MNASSEPVHGWRLVLDYTPFPDVLRGQFLSEGPVYRHLRFYGVAHITGGSVEAAAGLICLAYGVPGWAAFFLGIAALNLGGGYWYLTIDSSAAQPSLGV
jgi:hypothetical protein